MCSNIRACRTLMMSYSEVEISGNTGFICKAPVLSNTPTHVQNWLYLLSSSYRFISPVLLGQLWSISLSLKLHIPSSAPPMASVAEDPSGLTILGRKLVGQLFDRLHKLLLLFDYLAIGFWHIAVGSWKEGKWTWNWETVGPSSLIGTITHLKRVDIWRSPGSFSLSLCTTYAEKDYLSCFIDSTL